MACSGGRLLFYKLPKINHINTSLQYLAIEPCTANRLYSTKVKEIEDHIAKIPPTKARLNEAVKSYLKRVKDHEEFIKQEIKKFELGKKHLANIMGVNHATMTQDDIDEAIRYLFPSALYVPKGRPFMKHPDEVFKKQKAAEFDETGRPFHYLFYTSKPYFNEILHESAKKLQELDKYEDEMLAKSIQPDPERRVDVTGSTLFTKEELEEKLLERLKDLEYKNFVQVMERLIEHPYSNMASDLIHRYRTQRMVQLSLETVPEPQIGEDGRRFVTHEEARRKSARATVTVREPGTGKISINGKDIRYFDMIQSREQILFPLVLSGMLNKVDIEATVTLGGPTSQAGAIRYGISMCLRSFVSKDKLLEMKVAGLLQQDFRRRERKKPGQEGARRKYTWLKR